jgi:hypothetical protein
MLPLLLASIFSASAPRFPWARLVLIEGPYGRFDFRRGRARQLWLAGGIGGRAQLLHEAGHLVDERLGVLISGDFLSVQFRNSACGITAPLWFDGWHHGSYRATAPVDSPKASSWMEPTPIRIGRPVHP